MLFKYGGGTTASITVYPPAHPSIFLSIYLSIYLPTYLSVYPPVIFLTIMFVEACSRQC